MIKMKRKKLWIGLLIITICFFLLGTACKKNAEAYQGIQATFGINVNGEFQKTDSGRIGADQEQYEKYNTRGTVFYIFGIATGISTVIVFVKSRKRV